MRSRELILGADIGHQHQQLRDLRVLLELQERAQFAIVGFGKAAIQVYSSVGIQQSVFAEVELEERLSHVGMQYSTIPSLAQRPHQSQGQLVKHKCQLERLTLETFVCHRLRDLPFLDHQSSRNCFNTVVPYHQKGARIARLKTDEGVKNHHFREVWRLAAPLLGKGGIAEDYDEGVEARFRLLKFVPHQTEHLELELNGADELHRDSHVSVEPAHQQSDGASLK
jgi:hypothetical protein